MPTSDRLYELCCECKEIEQTQEKLIKDLEKASAIKRAAHELLEAMEDELIGLPSLLPSEKVVLAAKALNALIT